MILTTSCSWGGSKYDAWSSSRLVQADVRHYSTESQERVRQELISQKCLPEPGKDFKWEGCTIPTIYEWLIDYYKMREQSRLTQEKARASGL